MSDGNGNYRFNHRSFGVQSEPLQAPRSGLVQRQHQPRAFQRRLDVFVKLS
jgi:hypothetical protein